MIAFVALLVGYVIGAKAGSKDLDEVVGALKRLGGSEEFADVVTAVRSHLGHTLRELASGGQHQERRRKRRPISSTACDISSPARG